MQFTGSLAIPRLDAEAVKAALDQAAKTAIRGMLQEFISVALDNIPNWSGASRATFNQLAGQVGISTGASGGGVSVGEADSGGELILGDNGIYQFTYTTHLSWLVWNEFQNANENPDPGKWPPPATLIHPGPYKSQAFGVSVALHFLEDFQWPAPEFTAEIIKVG